MENFEDIETITILSETTEIEEEETTQIKKEKTTEIENTFTYLTDDAMTDEYYFIYETNESIIENTSQYNDVFNSSSKALFKEQDSTLILYSVILLCIVIYFFII